MSPNSPSSRVALAIGRRVMSRYIDPIRVKLFLLTRRSSINRECRSSRFSDTTAGQLRLSAPCLNGPLIQVGECRRMGRAAEASGTRRSHAKKAIIAAAKRLIASPRVSSDRPSQTATIFPHADFKRTPIHCPTWLKLSEATTLVARWVQRPRDQ